MQTGRISQSDDFTITNDVDFCYSDNNRNVFVPPENAQYIDRGGAAIAIKWGDILSTNTETVHFEYNECRDSDSKTCLGGGAILAYIADINIDNCNFSHNHSDSNGGAIAIVDSDEDNGCEGSIIANAEFNGNSAKKYGGAIYFSGNSTLTIDGCSFLTASDSIYLDGCEVTLNLKNSITLVASIATGSEKNSNTKLLDGATITFTNTEAIEIVHLTISANNVNNTFTFNTYNGSNTISFDDQDLSKVTFGAYIHSGTDSQHVIATGVTAIKEEYKAATPVNVVNDEYRQIKFYHA